MRSLGISLILVLFVAVASSCGGASEPEELSLEDYFDRLLAIEDESELRSSAARDDLEVVSGDTGDEAADEWIEFLSATLPIADDVIEQLRGLGVPEEAKPGHEAYILGLEDYIETLREVQGRLREDGLQDEVPPLWSGPAGEAYLEFQSACLALEEVAESAGLLVNLDCE